MPEAPSGSSFEADLRALREERGRSIADIERATRVPADVVRRFEDGALMQDPDYSAVYLRAFVKAYAEALDLSTSRVNAAFESARQGTYQGTLAPQPEPSPVEDLRPAEERASGEPDASPAAPTSDPVAATTPQPQSAAAPPDVAPPTTSSEQASDAEASESAPMVKALNTTQRLERTSSASPPPRRSSAPASLTNTNQSWGLILGIAAMSVLALSVVFWMIFSDPGPDLEPVASATVADTVAVQDTTAIPAFPVVPPPPQVGDSITITLVAADGPLQNFRMQAAPDIRRPFWIEQGAELTFTSPTEVIVWGNETAGGWRVDPEARVRIEGLTYVPATGAVLRLTRDRAQAVVDSLHRAQYEG
ncbi:MAG: helix-turn-helix domain-containing protein [Bacteroidota bacterium]